jgi:hypothetical protein
MIRFRKRLIGVTLALAAAVLPACQKNDEVVLVDGSKPLQYGQKVRGKVTYKGQPVVYGMVLLYSYDRSYNTQNRTVAPAANGMINTDGSYEIASAPLGPMMIVVATDPDADPNSFLRPVPLGGSHPDNPGGPFGSPLVTDPTGLPPGAPPPPPTPGVTPPLLPGEVPLPPNPAIEKLTAADKKLLKEIHGRFGTPGTSGLGMAVIEGEQTFNIELK